MFVNNQFPKPHFVEERLQSLDVDVFIYIYHYYELASFFDAFIYLILYILHKGLLWEYSSEVVGKLRKELIIYLYLPSFLCRGHRVIELNYEDIGIPLSYGALLCPSPKA